MPRPAGRPALTYSVCCRRLDIDLKRRSQGSADIPIAGRIAAVADVFDALTTTRRDKDSWSLEASRQYLVDQRGQHFDPACVDAFLRRWDEVLMVYSGRSDNVLAA